jgi:hypothetical protein
MGFGFQPVTRNRIDKMRILHLSDLHFGTEKDARNWYSQVAEDLKYDLVCHHLDALILSGDIANKCAPDEYKAAERFLGDLCGEFGLDSDQIIIVPGNHDLSWTTAKSAYRPVRRKDYKGLLDENCTICGDEFVEVLNKELYKQRFQNFSTFYQNVKSEPYPLEYDDQGILYHFQEQNLLILGLNSAWQVDHHYISRAGINPDAVSNALTRIRQNPDIYADCLKFAVWHHPLASAGEDRITDLGFMQRLSQAGFCIAFHGHIHKSETGLYCYDHSASGRKINIISAGTFGAPVREWVPGYPLQYNLLKLEGSELTVETRCRREPNGAWKPDAIWTQGPGKDPLPRYKIVLHKTPAHSTKRNINMKEGSCFVIMPFGSQLDNLYDLAIKPAVESENLECIRADKLPGGGNILADIVEHIHKAKVVIADLTGNRPNVFYELGMSHGLLQNVIMLTQNINELPFDLKAYRVIEYNMGMGADVELKKEIKRSIDSLIEWSKRSNPVKSFLSPDALPVPGNKHKAVRQELEKIREDLQNAKARLEEHKAIKEELQRLKEEKVQLQGIRQFSEDFFHKIFGDKFQNMKLEQIMERFLAEMEKKGEVSVSVPLTSETETSGGSKRKRIVFRPVKK